MNTILFVFLGITITAWKLVGYTGALMFTSRWFLQVWESRKAGKPVVPRLFWYISLVGSLLCLTYFVFGKNDSVGILSNLFPTAIAAYNIYLENAHSKNRT